MSDNSPRRRRGGGRAMLAICGVQNKQTNKQAAAAFCEYGLEPWCQFAVSGSGAIKETARAESGFANGSDCGD